jgi:AraC-like DNA-binding protein
MPPLAKPQYTLDFEPSLPERFDSLRAYVAHLATSHRKPLKTIAADMDVSPSTLSRKLNPAEGDTQRFNCDDLEQFLESTAEAAAVIQYLAAKYLHSPEDRKARALARVELLSTELASVLADLKGTSA